MLFRQEVIERKAARLHGDVLLTQPRSTSIIAIMLSVVIIATVAFATIGSYARTETVRGILSTSKPVSRIVVNRPGIIVGTFKREGDLVRKGDRLVLIDVDIRSETGAGVAAKSVEILDRQTSIAQAQSLATRQSTKMQGRKLDTQARDIKTQLNNLSRQIDIQQRVLESNRTILERASTIVEKGFISQLDYERRRQTALQSEQQLEILRQQAASAQANLKQIELDRQALTSQLDQEMAVIDSSLANLERERASTTGSGSYIITSPIDGRVTAVQFTTGQTVQPGPAIMTIMPTDAELEAELFAPSRAIGFVRPGQEVRLLVDAFPYQKFGSVRAKVATVSGTMIDPQQAYTPFKIDEPVFKVRVNIDRAGIAHRSDSLPLQPGMTLIANVVLERRSFLEWLLSPLSAVTRRNS
ncbi:HlyD family efflux transporter periplasmic adaptor subunit [uncultured Sphingomonas sp.]|uniref:HlyD family secretion protein n=1 Tax=uncultured Sphingomonas sp. TaxID=158754 RepID=UPI0025D63D07|nr:HlyD family efflux transporter periplasmic adaptor subunit [uncultured Sphingomonas sp.]